MSGVVEIRAIVRREAEERVVERLREAGIPRLMVMRVHAIGTAFAPDPANVGIDEGTGYRDMALVQFICPGDRSAMVTELIRHAAHTGKRGDGLVSVHPVLGITKIRTGETGLAVLG